MAQTRSYSIEMGTFLVDGVFELEKRTAAVVNL